MKNSAFRTLSAATALTVFGATPAVAGTFVNLGDSEFITFGGTEPGTSANLLLTLTSENSFTNAFTFSYILTNTSPLATNPSSRITGFGFDDVGADVSTGSASGDLSQIAFNRNFPMLGRRDVCVFAANCTGGSTGVVFGDPASGSFTLDYAGSGLTQITLDNFAVRYISTGARGQGSGVGQLVTAPVPEPATWAMMLLGFGFIGGAMRSAKRRQKLTISYT